MLLMSDRLFLLRAFPSPLRLTVRPCPLGIEPLAIANYNNKDNEPAQRVILGFGPIAHPLSIAYI
jgi:hypothetical protein